jgi:hypothetical protein
LIFTDVKSGNIEIRQLSKWEMFLYRF